MVGWPDTGCPVVVVAAKVIEWDFKRSGMRKVALQPAPRMRRSSSSIFSIFAGVFIGGDGLAGCG